MRLAVLKLTPIVSAAWANSAVKGGWSFFLYSNGRSTLARSIAKARWSSVLSILLPMNITKIPRVRPKVIHTTHQVNN